MLDQSVAPGGHIGVVVEVRGRHTAVVNLNGDRAQPFATVDAVLARQFCATK